MKMEEVISLADEGKFAEFKDKVTQSLEDKLRNHPVVKDNATKIQAFADVEKKSAEIPDMEIKEY